MTFEKLKEILLYYEPLDELMYKYDCRIRGKTLYIYKPIPVKTFYDFRARVKHKYDIDNIIVDS